MNISLKIGKRSKNTTNERSPSTIKAFVSKTKDLALVPVPVCTTMTKIVASTVQASLEPLKINVNSNEHTPYEETKSFEKPSQNEVTPSIAWNFRNDVAQQRNETKYLPSPVSMSPSKTPVRSAPPPPQNSSQNTDVNVICDSTPVSGSSIHTPSISSRIRRKDGVLKKQCEDMDAKETTSEPLINLKVPLLQVSASQDAKSELKPTPAPRNAIQKTKVELPLLQNVLQPLDIDVQIDKKLIQTATGLVSAAVPLSSLLPPLSPRPRRMNVRIVQSHQESFILDETTEDLPPPIPPRPKRPN
ncbi:hypothetical protein FQR65_LT01115 [Abscondita terminalis]|nr:hypothetical protein FQR65_LT01115 [Abscondita terminalis]